MTTGRSAFSLSLSALDVVDLKIFTDVMAVNWHALGVLFCVLLFTREGRHVFELLGHLGFLFICFFLLGYFFYSEEFFIYSEHKNLKKIETN